MTPENSPLPLVQLLLLPGLGGDHRMAYRQLSLPYECITPDYIPIERKETLRDYAMRFARHLESNNPIDPSRPLVLAGYSFGSAIIQELSQTLSARGLILIGGLRSSDELRPYVRYFGRYISGWLPLPVYRLAEALMPIVMRRVSGIPPADAELSRTMYHELPKGFYRAGYEALANWAGCAVTIPVFRIHGELDHIIQCPTPSENLVVIPEAKHLIGLAQPSIVNNAIEGFVTRLLRAR